MPGSFAIAIVVFAAWAGVMAVVRLHARTAALSVPPDDMSEPFGDFPAVHGEPGADHGGARLNADRGMHSAVSHRSSLYGEDY